MPYGSFLESIALGARGCEEVAIHKVKYMQFKRDRNSEILRRAAANAARTTGQQLRGGHSRLRLEHWQAG